MKYAGIIRHYQKYFSIQEGSIVTLLEGHTPLLQTTHLAENIFPGLKIYLKFEGLNPTGSFKDRGMTYAISKAVEQKAQAVICASTGNTSASAAAYAAKAGLQCAVIIPEGKIALGKLTQALMHGAKVIEIEGNFDEALEIVRQIADQKNIEVVNSINPFRIEGQKTAAFEVCDALGDAPTYHALPVGNAGNITAYWKGYNEYKDKKVSTRLPKMLGFQAAGSAPIVTGKVVTKPETLATAIRIGNPASWKSAEAARDESGGLIDSVTDEEIVAAYQLVAKSEGYFCEPASAASIAGVVKLAQKGFFQKGETVVCTLTGHGLKDPDSAISVSQKPVKLLSSTDKIIDYLKL
jgi:threonine synthase